MEPTKDHKMIRQWAESRSAIPAALPGTGDGVPAVLGFIIPGANYHNRNLTEVTWEDFFAKFDLFGLAFVFQNITEEGDRSSRNEILLIQPQHHDHRHWN